MSKSSAATNPTPLLETLQVLQFPIDDEFDPDPFEVVPGEEFTLQFTGTGSTTVEIYATATTICTISSKVARTHTPSLTTAPSTRSSTRRPRTRPTRSCGSPGPRPSQ